MSPILYHSSLFKQFHFDVDYEFAGSKPSGAKGRSASRDYLARSMNIGTSSKLDKPRSDEPPTGYRSHPNETPIFPTSSSTRSTSRPSNIASLTTEKSSAPQRTRKNPLESQEAQQPQSTIIKGHEEDAGTTSKTLAVSLVQIAKIQNFSINEIPGQIDRLDVDVDELTEVPEVPEPLTETTMLSQIDGLDLDISTVRGISSSADKADDGNDPTAQLNKRDDEQQQFRPRPEYRPPDVANPETTDTTKGQLFQASAKEKQEPPVLKVRGM
jgi:hypothetical protein